MTPAVVAFLRGAIEAAVLAAIGVAIVALGDVTAGQLAPWSPIGLLALRQVEGLADGIDPARRRAQAEIGTALPKSP
jgi:hypothetical protein